MFAVRFRAWLLGGVFTAGAMCIVVRDGGELLLVRPRYRRGWGLPGGFMRGREQPDAAMRRELAEEVGIVEVDVDVVGTYVAHGRRHIEHLYETRVRDHELSKRYAFLEIAEARWWDPSELPELQPEAHAALELWQSRRGSTPPRTSI
jgi:ADP-ribose pyrophosphatase YjhB (NUDIX family)